MIGTTVAILLAASAAAQAGTQIYAAKKQGEVAEGAAKAQATHDDALLRAEQQRYQTQQAAIAPYQQAQLGAMQSLGSALQPHYPAFGGGPGMPPGMMPGGGPGMPPGPPPQGMMPPPPQMSMGRPMPPPQLGQNGMIPPGPGRLPMPGQTLGGALMGRP